MDFTKRANGGRMPERASQTEQRCLQRLEHIALKGLNDPDALSRVEILEICKLVYCRLSETVEGVDLRQRTEAVAEMVRLSQELGLE